MHPKHFQILQPHTPSRMNLLRHFSTQEWSPLSQTARAILLPPWEKCKGLMLSVLVYCLLCHLTMCQGHGSAFYVQILHIVLQFVQCFVGKAIYNLFCSFLLWWAFRLSLLTYSFFHSGSAVTPDRIQTGVLWYLLWAVWRPPFPFCLSLLSSAHK